MRAANISMLRAGFWALSPIEQVFPKPSARVVGSSASPIDLRCLRTRSRGRVSILGGRHGRPRAFGQSEAMELLEQTHKRHPADKRLMPGNPTSEIITNR